MALIVISGHAQSGKNTLGDIMKAKFKENYFTMAYANDLKRKLQKDFDLSWEQLHGELKEVPDTRYVKNVVDGKVTHWTPREIMQFMGTDVYRAIDDDFWIKQLFKYIDRNYLENVIITDGRFPSEIAAVTSRGGIHIRVERVHDKKVHGKTHVSETALDDSDTADFVVNNNGTKEDLAIVAEKIIKEIENGR